MDVQIESYHKMIPTTAVRGISQKLKMTITRSLEANFLTELAANFFCWLTVKRVVLNDGISLMTFQNIIDCYRSKIDSKNKNKNLHFYTCKM